MASFLNLITAAKRMKKNKLKLKKSDKAPQKRVVCLRVLTISPKKPNSANRPIIKANTIKNKIKLTAKIPGESHNLQQHSIVLIKNARVRDLIGVRYAAIRGKFDLLPVSNRKTSRSCYGAKNKH
jgi:small subunit ribosomal protein S12